MAQRKQRIKLLTHYFDRATNQHQIFVYDKAHNLTAHITVTPEGKVAIVKGELMEARR